jgi:hypothetical protein
MDAAGLLNRLETRAIGKALGIFLILTLLVPIVLAVAVSFGPPEWMAQYLYPAFRFQPALYVLAGALASLVISRFPILNTLTAALLGSFVLLGFALAFGASARLEPSGFAFYYLVVPVAWCFVGAAGMALLKRGVNAL